MDFKKNAAHLQLITKEYNLLRRTKFTMENKQILEYDNVKTNSRLQGPFKAFLMSQAPDDSIPLH